MKKNIAFILVMLLVSAAFAENLFAAFSFVPDVQEISSDSGSVFERFSAFTAADVEKKIRDARRGSFQT